ncbi:MAG: TIGR00341 family protein [Spirulinaceae cyanobacterium]
MKSFLAKRLFYPQQIIGKYWNAHSGEWKWLVERPVPIASLNKLLWQSSVPSFGFYFMLWLSGVIATLGLLANSAAVIIGAMIIAPLMGPIIGSAYAMVVANRRLLKRSLLTTLTGCVLTIITAFVATYILGLKSVGTEVLARSSPTLIDLGIAMAAGAAGAFANSRRRIAEALPGVAISVALVPPLSVIGIGLALGRNDLSTGASVLFVTNLTGIIFTGGLVFLCQRYGSLKRARRGLFVSLVMLSLLMLPLGLSLKNLLAKKNFRRDIERLITTEKGVFTDTNIRYLKVFPRKKGLFVEVEVAAPLNSISEEQVKQVKAFLESELGQPIHLQVQVIPVEILEFP